MSWFKSKDLLIKVFTIFIAFVFLVLIFCLYKSKPYYFSSKEVFLGNLYRGKLIPLIHDNEKAKKYLEQAVAKYNSAEAQCDIGEIYAEENNYQLAGYYYFTAAMHGSQRCERYFLKLSYLPDEEIKVFQMTKKMADDRKFASAQFMVGKRLIEGVGVSPDTKAGIAYLEKAVAQNHWGASLYLAGIYIKGELLPQDIDKANKLMEVR